MNMPRYLTKSRFKLGIECPTKLYYTSKPDQFVNTKQEDEFLRALAEGGFQVGELAKLMYPCGIEVTETKHEDALARTADLLARDQVTVFEAAIRYGDLFIRADILIKCGNHFELIEVKAKSYDPGKQNYFSGKSGNISTSLLPYLQDVAFQKYVLERAYPDYTVDTFLMLADKSRRASVDCLNQRFKIHRVGLRSRVVATSDLTLAGVGEPVLTAVPVDEYVDRILAMPLELSTGATAFDDAVQWMANHYREDRRISPRIGTHCSRCEFRTLEPDPRSGFHECWKDVNDWEAEDFGNGTVLDLWNFRKKDELIERGIVKLTQVTEDDLELKPAVVGMSRSERQWKQVLYARSGQVDPFFLNREGLAADMSAWCYPLHFIDFETSRAALPFHHGRRPYEQVAFQFSHHVVHEDGRLEHRGQFLDACPGVFPNYAFVRALREQLVGDNGTILRWATHENSVLNDIFHQLEDDPSPPDDRDVLQCFIRDITVGKDKQVGARTMVDLCKLAELYYFHPQTKGSSSIKKVLPAVLATSAFLRERYSQAIYGAAGGIPSLNFENWAWWRSDNGTVHDPYALLPPVYAGLEPQRQFDEDETLAHGGAAMTAYARLQFEDIDDMERERLKAALLKYCELDTLAMVMIWQAWTQD